MISARHARKIRHQIEQLSVSLSDETALEVPEMFPVWVPRAYEMGDRVRFEGTLYKCVQAHPENDTYTPDTTVSLWTEVLIPDPSDIPEWKQPESTNPYMIGDRVSYDGHVWVCTIDYNVFAPGVAGWEMVE